MEVSDLSLSQKINISTASGGFVGGSAALLFRESKSPYWKTFDS